MVNDASAAEGDGVKVDAGSPLVVFEAVDLGYGGRAVLHGVNLEIRRGDFMGLVGPNGAGKTTLLRGVIGLLEPLRGTIRLAPGPRAGRITLGYVPQVQYLDPIYPLSAADVVAMGGYHRYGLLGRPGRKERAFLAQCLEEVDMAEHARRSFGDLSAGQKQRVLIARALYTRPDLLLLDEPTSGADYGVEQRIMELLGRLNEEGYTILLVCHELDMVQAAVKEILWISHGVVRRDASSRSLTDRIIREVYRK